MKVEGVKLLKKAAWAPLAVVVLHGICGHLFGHEPYVDPVSHFLGGMAIAFFLREAGVQFEKVVGRPTELGLSLGAFGLASFAAVGWELAEWGSDIFLGSNIQRSGAAPLRDLALGLMGAGVFLVLRFCCRKEP